MSEFKDDTFLARWLNNELNEEELKAFKESPEYASFEKIRQGAGQIDAAEFDSARVLDNIKQQQRLNIGVRPARRWRVYTVAASILILLGIACYGIFFSSQLTTYQTTIGQKMEIILPDGSEVILNSNSSLTYSEDDWEENRELKLVGAGYFNVEKGERFVVRTTSGEVSVLGTQFTVQEIDDFFEVKCFEGSVQVTSEDETDILKPKTGLRKLRGTRFVRRTLKSAQPSVFSNESSFESVPLKYVLKELNNQYGVTFEGETNVDELLYNGSFPHDSLDLALKIVLDAVNVNYTKKGNVIVLSSN